MFDHDGRVMLTDFGISKALQAATGFTATGMIIGTPHYMSPEQGKGAPVDGRADQYSLGVVGYRMITAELPFSGDSVHTIIYKHIYEEPPLASTKRPGIPGTLTGAISRALSKEPDARYPTMEEFATAVWPEQPVASPTRGRGAARPRTRTPADAPTESPGAPAPALQGLLTINADPFGEVYIDGVDVGQTPVVEYAVKPGSHKVRIERPGFKTVTETMQADANNTVHKRYTLLPE